MNSKAIAFDMTLVFAMLVLTVFGCSEPTRSVVEAHSEGEMTTRATARLSGVESVEEMLNDAEMKYREAQQLEHAWKATPKHVQAARKALQANDQKAAMTAAKRALHSANASLAQAMRGEDECRNHVVK